MQTRETAATHFIWRPGSSTDEPVPAGRAAATQIRQLKNLSSGWHHDEPSCAPDSEALEWLAGRFERDYPSNAPRAYIFPNPEGTVTALWKIDSDVQVEVEINLGARTAERWIHNISTLTSRHDVVDLNASHALGDLGARNIELTTTSR